MKRHSGKNGKSALACGSGMIIACLVIWTLVPQMSVGESDCNLEKTTVSIDHVQQLYDMQDYTCALEAVTPIDSSDRPDLDESSAYSTWEQAFERYRAARRRRKVAIVLTGAGLIAASGFAWSGHIHANTAYDDYMKSIDSSQIQSNWTDYESRVKRRNSLGGVAIGLAVLEVIWLLSAPDKPDDYGEHSMQSVDERRFDLAVDNNSLRVVLRF